MVQALISCRMDYCNSLFDGNVDGLISDELAAVYPECGCTPGVGALNSNFCSRTPHLATIRNLTDDKRQQT